MYLCTQVIVGVYLRPKGQLIEQQILPTEPLHSWKVKWIETGEIRKKGEALHNFFIFH